MKDPSNDKPGKDPEGNPLPCCQHCGHVLDAVGTYQWATELPPVGVGYMIAMFCQNPPCRKVLGTQILVVPKTAQPSAIAKPH